MDEEEPAILVSRFAFKKWTPEQAQKFAAHLRSEADRIERDYAYWLEHKAKGGT